MDDSSSIASFEDMGPPQRQYQHGLAEDTELEKLKAIINRSAVEGNPSRELDGHNVPDICYVLKYRQWTGKIVELHRGLEPVNVQLDERSTPVNAKKPVLEIVTTILSTTTKLSTKPREHVVSHPSPGFDGYFNHSRRPHPYDRQDEDAQTSITKTEKTAMDRGPLPCPRFHHRAALARYRVSQPETHDEKCTSTTAKHIGILLNFIQKTMGGEIRQEEARHSNSTPAATFDKLWLLLKPGEVVYAQYLGQWMPFVVSFVLDSSSDGERIAAEHRVDCWNIFYTGNLFCRTMNTFYIPLFSGEQAIASLPIVPARFFSDRAGMTPGLFNAEQINLGKMVWDLAKGCNVKSYEGNLVERPNENEASDWTVSPTRYVKNQVIVDCEGYNSFHKNSPREVYRRNHHMGPKPHQPVIPRDHLPHFAPRCRCNSCNAGDLEETLSPFAGFEGLDPACDDAPTNDLYYLVLAKQVAGFILGERRWGHFNVELLRDVKFDKETFKYLVLDDEIKLTVKALVGKFASKNGQISPWPSDFVQNKGQGRIFLLHGPPGVGKTCTAECVAELMRRPLLLLTNGDFNSSAGGIEENLEYHLKLGERFGAIVLLDEADVYLERRQAMDTYRNGLVSVFLRALEYYKGVLFLTTNRVQTFDSAFTSRIHVALHYGPLKGADRERIWQTSFERLERDSGGKVHVTVAAREYVYDSRDVRDLHWNGREIRNSLQTAVALAETEALEDEANVVMVTDKHLRNVVKMSRGFKTFLRRRKLKHRFPDDDVEQDEDEDVEDDDDDDEARYSDDEDEGMGRSGSLEESRIIYD